MAVTFYIHVQKLQRVRVEGIMAIVALFQDESRYVEFSVESSLLDYLS